MQIEISRNKSKRICEIIETGEKRLRQELEELRTIRNELISCEDKALSIIGHKLRQQEDCLAQKIRAYKVVRESMAQVSRLYRRMEIEIEESSEGYETDIVRISTKSINSVIAPGLIDKLFVR